MKTYLLPFLLSLFAVMSASAQKLDFSVLSFGLDEFSMAAQRGSQYAATDGNGDLYSIIKVKDADGQPVPDGFMFDFGLPNTLKVEPQPNGEQWVWVQRNAKQVTIYHNNYRTIEKYDLGLTIEAGRVYEMVVTMDRVERVVTKTVRKQVLQFAVQPAGEHAVVKVKEASAANYESWGEVASDGTIDRYIPYGSYDYMVVADDYDASMGRVVLDDASQTHVERVSLTPNFGFLVVNDKDGVAPADIYVDNKKIGTLPYRDGKRWAPGDYSIEVVKGELYHPYEGTFSIRKGETTTLSPSLQPDFAQVELSVAGGASISIDQKPVGSGAWSGPLKTGQHTIVSTLPNHRDSRQVITVEAGRALKLSLTPPTPITGSLYVRSTPSGATICIDGRECGTTPKAFPELIIGSHEVELSLAGYEPEVRSVQVKEGEEATVEMQLKELPKGIQTFTVKGVKFNMVLVEHGTFQMGSTSGDDDEKPVHSVTISKDYWIGETEVTQALWYAVMGLKPTADSEYQWESTDGLGDNYPAYFISWNDCQEFITKLNELTGEQFSMPTEAKWEYAAKGGNRSQGYTYSGSNNIEDVAWYEVNSEAKGESSPDYGTHPVATKQPNELGIYDMTGNVWEWCSDGYGSYSSTAVNDPIGAKSGSKRVLRGGSWSEDATYCRTADRGSYIPTGRYSNFGFRLALSPSKQSQVNWKKIKNLQQLTRE